MSDSYLTKWRKVALYTSQQAQSTTSKACSPKGLRKWPTWWKRTSLACKRMSLGSLTSSSSRRFSLTSSLRNTWLSASQTTPCQLPRPRTTSGKTCSSHLSCSESPQWLAQPVTSSKRSSCLMMTPWRSSQIFVSQMVCLWCACVTLSQGCPWRNSISRQTKTTKRYAVNKRISGKTCSVSNLMRLSRWSWRMVKTFMVTAILWHLSTYSQTLKKWTAVSTW